MGTPGSSHDPHLVEPPGDFLSVFVTSPVGIEGYTVVTKTNMTDKYPKGEYIVTRCYNEFIELHDNLIHDYRDIPPVPKKSTVEQFRFTAKSMELQCQPLDVFLKSIASNSELKKDSSHLNKFLVEKPYGNCSLRISARLSADVEEISTSVIKMVEGKMGGKVLLLDGGMAGSHDMILDQIKSKQVSNFSSASGLDGLDTIRRKATCLSIELSRWVYEGQVTEYEKEYTDSSNTDIKCININLLSTTNQTERLQLSQPYISSLEEENVVVGNFVTIDVESGAVTKGGDASSRSNTPEAIVAPNPVLKRKKIIQNVTLNDLYQAISTPRKEQGIYSYLSVQRVSEDTIDKVIKGLIHKGLAKYTPGIIHISEAHMLNIECFSFISYAIESSLCLSVYLSTVVGMCGFREYEVITPNAMLTTMLPRLVVIRLREDTINFPPATFFWNRNEACELMTLVADRVKRKKMTNSVFPILLTGPRYSGKKGLAYQISQELGSEVIFRQMDGTREYPVGTAKKILKDNLQQTVSLRMKQTEEAREGEVTELISKETDYIGDINGKSTNTILIGLQTKLEEKLLEFGGVIANALREEKVTVGDLIRIDIKKEEVIKIGRSDAFSKEAGHENHVYLPLPEGEVRKNETFQVMTLYNLHKEIDAKRGRGLSTQVRKELKSLTSTSGAAEDSYFNLVDEAITSLINDKVVESYPGVLYVDEVDSLGADCIEIISKAYQLKTLLVPVLIFSTQKDISLIGLPPNMLSNMVIIHTEESGVTALIKESKPRMICSVPALEKEIKFIDIFTGLNAVFGAGAVPSLVLAATNSEAHQYTIGFLIGVFIAFAVSSLRYSSTLTDLQELVKDAKTSKDADKTRVEKEKIKAIRWRVFTGFIIGLLGILCVLGALFTFLGGRYFHGRLADPKADSSAVQKAVFKDIPAWVYVISAIELILLLFGYMKFAKKMWKKLPFTSRLERQKTL